MMKFNDCNAVFGVYSACWEVTIAMKLLGGLVNLNICDIEHLSVCYYI